MIIKICKVHGELTMNEAWLVKSRGFYRCRLCRRDRRREERFKITSVEYKKLLQDQNNVCAICKKPESYSLSSTNYSLDSNKPRQLSVDHCHSSKKIRGLLCNQCNIGLGKFKDSIEYLLSAVEYLKSSHE